MIPHVIVGTGPHRVQDLQWLLVFGRPTLEDLRQQLRAPFSRSAGPIGISQGRKMKAAWKDSRKDLFYPYCKTHAQTIGEQD